VQRPFGGDVRQRLHQEMGYSHPRLDCPERMLDRLTPLAHFFRVLVEPALHGFENMLVLPARDPSFLAGGAAVLDGAARAGMSLVATQDQPVFFVRVAVGETFTCRADDPHRPRGGSPACQSVHRPALAFEVIGFGRVTVMPAFSHARISVLLK
jgi:hypothetical protein